MNPFRQDDRFPALLSSSVVHHSLFFLDTTGTAAKKEAESGAVGSHGSMGGAGVAANPVGAH